MTALRGGRYGSRFSAEDTHRPKAHPVKVETKDISETRKQIVVAFEAADVDRELANATSEFVQHVRVPGFRPGRVPIALIRKRYEKDLLEELKKTVVSRAYREGLQQAKLDVVDVVDFPETPIAPGAPAEITITVDIRPAFELPEYKGLPVKALDTAVSEAEVDRLIDDLRRERAEFKTADRAAMAGDYVKFGFEGTVDGRKISELVPDRPIYGAMPSTWEEAGATEGLLPGIGTHLIGMKAGDAKAVDITFPAQFTAPALAGKLGTYQVAVHEVRERVLPEVDAAFLEAQKVKTVEELRNRVRVSIERGKQSEDRMERRRQVVEALSAKAEFPIPESLIANETDSLLRQMIESNIRKGVPQEELESKKDEIYAAARKAAIQRSKLRLLVMRVAEQEKIEVDARDLSHAIYVEASRTNEKPEKLAKELEKDQRRLRALQQSVLFDKALDFLVHEATVSPARTAGQTPQPSENP